MDLSLCKLHHFFLFSLFFPNRPTQIILRKIYAPTNQFGLALLSEKQINKCCQHLVCIIDLFDFVVMHIVIEWGCKLYGGVGNLLTFVSFCDKTWGCGLSAVRVIVRKYGTNPSRVVTTICI